LEYLSGRTLDGRLKELEQLVLSCENLAALRTSLSLGRLPEDDEETISGHAPGYEELPDDLTIMTLSGFYHDEE
jgi:hypothetical protein